MAPGYRSMVCGGGLYRDPPMPPSQSTGNLMELGLAPHKDCCLFSFLPGPTAAPASPRLHAPTQPPKDTSGSPKKATFNRMYKKLFPMASKIAGNSEHTKSQCFVLFKWVSCVLCDLQFNKVVLKIAPCLLVQPPPLLLPHSCCG